MIGSYEEWLVTVPVEITGDPLWRMEGYRFALFAADLAWHDVCKLVQDKRIKLLTRIARLLLTMIPSERGYKMKEEHTPYTLTGDNDDLLAEMLIS